MGNPLHFIQASDTSAFAALHTEQGALPSQYEALQAYLKKIGLGRFGTLWAEPVTGQATPAGCLHFVVYAAGRRRHPLSRLDAGEGPEQARAALRRARSNAPSRRHARRRPAPQGAVHPFGGQCLRRQRPSRARQLGPAPARHGRSLAPILWGQPENGETPSGVTGAAAAATRFPPRRLPGRRHTVPFPVRAVRLALPPEQERRPLPERQPEPPQALPGQRREMSSSGAVKPVSSEPLLLGILLGVFLLFLLRSCVKTTPEPLVIPETSSVPAESPEDAARKAEWANLLREKSVLAGFAGTGAV